MVIGEYDPDGRRRHQAACGFSPGSSGNDASNTVPCPGAERSSKEPPASATRSSMPASPRLAPAAARRRAAATSKPPPSSRTESSSRAPLANRRSHKLRARACRTTLLIASCAERKLAHALERMADGLDAFLDARARLQLDLQRGQRLADVVVQIARQAPALLLLHLEQPARQGAQALLREF